MLRNNNTIFSISSLSSILLGSGALLVCLLVIVRPEASLGLGPVQRTVFWALHVGAGIIAMFAASQLIRRSLLSQLNILPCVILCGVTGTLLITPLYLLIDHLWPVTHVEEIDGWLDHLHQTGIFGTLIAEFLEVLPWTMTAWLMINLPLLNQPLLTRLTGSDDPLAISLDNSVHPLPVETRSEPAGDQPSPKLPGPVAPAPVVPATKIPTTAKHTSKKLANEGKLLLVEPAGQPGSGVTGIHQPTQTATTTHTNSQIASAVDLNQDATTDPQAVKATKLLQSLPGIFGKDIITISSDLHCLNVFTLVGKTTVLGNIRDVANELRDSGLQVHRSHWVAHNHVDRIVNAGGQAACVMSNGIRVPISRRRWKEVRDFYGQGVINRNSENQGK